MSGENGEIVKMKMAKIIIENGVGYHQHGESRRNNGWRKWRGVSIWRNRGVKQWRQRRRGDHRNIKRNNKESWRNGALWPASASIISREKLAPLRASVTSLAQHRAYRHGQTNGGRGRHQWRNGSVNGSMAL